ncbi:MAG: TrbI/VirB10 family protein [Alphaproteobacteria bacterium]|nr:TrbI/VirB10 family protein [Alphaproteobacteria bacterium]
MSKLKEQISQLRHNTPKRVQWLLLAAAFVVVLILLTLVWGDKKHDKDLAGNDNTAAELILIPDEPINWAETQVGNRKQENVKITATAPIDIISVTQNTDVSGFDLRTACTGRQRLGAKQSCSLSLNYEPSVAMPVKQNVISIVWRSADDKDATPKTTKVVVTLGAIAPVQDIQPVVIPEPEYEPEIESDWEPEPVQQEIIREIETIAPPVTFDDEEVVDEYIPAPEACSDFAFPGYDAGGRQIGWIKPESGAYYFHPFSDTECDNPTGVYNPDNGIITDIDNRGKKIGTDAEHIGYAAYNGGMLPELSNKPAVRVANRATQSDTPENSGGARRLSAAGTFYDVSQSSGGIMKKKDEPKRKYLGSGNSVLPSQPYDRQFILRQYKPIPATIVSEVRADPEALENSFLPVRATVDRNVYSDAGRNVIIPAGTLMLGYVTGKIPGPYTTIGRMQIKWYQFILPNGMEYNFNGDKPFSGDSQGRSGVLGRGSTDYLEQFFMPMLTAIVPAAVNLIAPISDAFVNQIDLDNNTVVQSGMVRSSELAKNEIITAWNQVAQKLLVDMMDNAVPPFTIPAGTRITVYSPEDLVASCGLEEDGKKCSLGYADEGEIVRANYTDIRNETLEAVKNINYDDPSWVGQVRSFQISECCDGAKPIDDYGNYEYCKAFDYATLVFYCQSSQYKAINNAKQEALWENQNDSSNKNSIASKEKGSQTYNEQVLGLEYDSETGAIKNPFKSDKSSNAPAENVLMCLDGTPPDANGCCTGEIYTDMGDQGFNCCPESGGDCFPPML